MAFNYFQGAAGLYQYINDNFLHAPSVDLGRDSIKCLAELMLAQAQECFLEKVVMEKKRGALPSKISAQASFMYKDVYESMTNHAALIQQFDKSWSLLVQVKSKYFAAMAQYHKSMQCEDEDQFGELVARLQAAELLAMEANKLAATFNSSYPTFCTLGDDYFFTYCRASNAVSPAEDKTDKGSFWSRITAAAAETVAENNSSSTMLEATRLLLAKVTDGKAVAIKDNDVVYHEVIPDFETLSPPEKLQAVKPISFADLCSGGASEIPKIVGPDIFAKLVPMQVHEAHSLYSEEKAKLLRLEENKILEADEEMSATLESMDLVKTLDQLKRLSKSNTLDEYHILPGHVAEWHGEVVRVEDLKESLGQMEQAKQRARGMISSIGLLLDEETRDCEAMRLKFMDWPQQPSVNFNGSIRQELKRHRETMDRAGETDKQLQSRWQEVRNDVETLRRPMREIETYYVNFIASGHAHDAKVANILDQDLTEPDGVLGEQLQIEKLNQLVTRIKTLKTERKDAFEDLRVKLHKDDISALLLLNRNRESELFETELAKFKPLSQKIDNNISLHERLLQELSMEYDVLVKDSIGLKTIEGRERKRVELMNRWKKSIATWKECREGVKRGSTFYQDLMGRIERTSEEAKSFARQRAEERNALSVKMQSEAAEKGQQALREQLEKLRLSSKSLVSEESSEVGSIKATAPPHSPSTSLPHVPSEVKSPIVTSPTLPPKPVMPPKPAAAYHPRPAQPAYQFWPEPAQPQSDVYTQPRPRAAHQQRPDSGYTQPQVAYQPRPETGYQPQPETGYNQPRPRAAYQPRSEPVYQPRPNSVYTQLRPQATYQPRPEPLYTQPRPQATYQPRPEPVYTQPRQQATYQPRPEPLYTQPRPEYRPMTSSGSLPSPYQPYGYQDYQRPMVPPKPGALGGPPPPVPQIPPEMTPQMRPYEPYQSAGYRYSQSEQPPAMYGQYDYPRPQVPVRYQQPYQPASYGYSNQAPQQQAYPPQQQSYASPQQQAYPPQQSNYPIQQSNYPLQQSNYPLQQSNYPPQQYLPHQSSFPPQQSSDFPQQSNYPPGQWASQEYANQPPGYTGDTLQPRQNILLD